MRLNLKESMSSLRFGACCSGFMKELFELVLAKKYSLQLFKIYLQ